MFASLGRTFLTGLIAILPVLLTLYLMYWFVLSTEAVLGGVIRLILPEEYYWPGMGVVIGLLAVFAIGLLMHAYLVQRVFSLGEALLYRLPLIKTIYRAIRDFFDYFSPQSRKEFEQVVAVSIGDKDMEVIGFVTQASTDHLPRDLRGGDRVLVYLPLSYMIGGYTVLMPRSAIRPLDMTMEEAMRFTLTAGVAGSGQEHRSVKARHTENK